MPRPSSKVCSLERNRDFLCQHKEKKIISDMVEHTARAIQWGEALGGWTVLSEEEIFELEYWELEQAKLKLAPAKSEYDGKIALVTGAASGIGKACVEAFASKGAAVIAMDVNPKIKDTFEQPGVLGASVILQTISRFNEQLMPAWKPLGASI